MKQIKLITITLILCMFVGGASAGITYNAGTNTITVTGYTETSSCTFVDLYNADVAGGWGVITAGNGLYNQFCINGFLQIGDGITVTWFADTEKQIAFTRSPSNIALITMTNLSHFRCGEVTDLDQKLTEKGCCIFLPSETNAAVFRSNAYPVPYGEVCLYNTYFSTPYGYNYDFAPGLISLRMWSCITDKSSLYVAYSQYVDCDLLTLTGCIKGISYASDQHVYNNVRVLGGDYAIYTGWAENVTFRNFYSRGTTYLVFFNTLVFNDVYYWFIDADVDTWAFNAYRSRATHVYRQYTFNLQTTPNAKITIMNHTDIVYQDYAYDNGTIDEQVFTSGIYTTRLSGGPFSPIVNVYTSQNPYSIEIKKVGYHTYAQEFTLNEPIKWHIMLLPDRVQVGSSIIRPARRS